MGTLADLFYKDWDTPSWDQPGYKPRWNAKPADDKTHPWTGINKLDQLRAQGQPPLPPEAEILGAEKLGDRFPYAYRIPAPRDFDRAYKPTLQFEDSIPGQRFQELMMKLRLQNYHAREFERPKTNADIFGRGWEE